MQEIAVYSRYMRTSMLETLNSDYLRTARAKGISERRVIVRHAFRNALIPLTTFAAIDIGAIAGGLIITEQIFEYPGMGLYFLNAFSNADYPSILPWMMIVVAFVVVFNLLADLSYAWLDPRIRLTDDAPDRPPPATPRRVEPAAPRHVDARSGLGAEAAHAGRAGVAPLPPAQARDDQHGRPVRHHVHVRLRAAVHEVPPRHADPASTASLQAFLHPQHGHWFGTERHRLATCGPTCCTAGASRSRSASSVALLSTVIGTVVGVDRRLLRRLARQRADARHRPVPRDPVPRRR